MHPLNVGLMFFNPAPQKFFPQTQIDVVQFPEGPGGDLVGRARSLWNRVQKYLG